jgi:hypothetical protein
MSKDNVDILLIIGGDSGNKSLANLDRLLSILLWRRNSPTRLAWRDIETY